MPPVPLLKGRENYHSWSIKMKAYLTHQDLWSTIEAPTGGRLSTDATQLAKAHSIIVLSCDDNVLATIEKKSTAKLAWEALKKAYEDGGYSRLVGLLIKLVTTKLENCSSVEEYINIIVSTNNQVHDMKVEMPDAAVGALMLAGLPSKYHTLVLAIGGSTTEITADLVKQKILQEVKMESDDIGIDNYQVHGLYSKNSRGRSSYSRRGFSRSRGNNRFRRENTRSNTVCFRCNRTGHFARDCQAGSSRQGGNNNSNGRSFVAQSQGGAAQSSNNEYYDDYESDGGDNVNFAAAYIGRIDRGIRNNNNNNSNDFEWVVDSGATRHMCKHRNLFLNMRASSINSVLVANKNRLHVSGEGEALIYTTNNEKVLLQNVLYVPHIATNLLSIGCIMSNGGEVKFSIDECIILNRRKQVMFRAQRTQSGLYVIRRGNASAHCSNTNEVNVNMPPDDEPDASALSIQLWHRRLGHLNEAYLRKLMQEGARGIKFRTNEHIKNCVQCINGKMTKQSFKSSESRASKRLQLIHTDLAQMQDLSFKKYKYFLTFLDDFSRKSFVVFLRSKSQVAAAFAQFIVDVETQTGDKIQRIRSDNGREYITKQLLDKLKIAGIKHELTVPYNPQQNGRAERLNRSLKEIARTSLLEAKLPPIFWAETIATASHLYNRWPKRSVQMKTPEELWTGIKPDLSYLRVFGSRAFSLIPDSKRRVMGAKPVECIMVGYATNRKAYRLYHKPSNQIIENCHVRFIEEGSTQDLVHLPIDENNEATDAAGNDEDDEDSGSDSTDNIFGDDLEKLNLSDIDNLDNVDDEEDNKGTDNPKKGHKELSDPSCTIQSEKSEQLRRSNRKKSLPEKLKKDYVLTYSAVTGAEDPSNYHQAINGPDAPHWIEAMDKEHKSLIKNNTYQVCDLPPGRKVVGSKWHFKKKSNGEFKARFCAQGFTQIKGIDYHDTFSPVVRLTTIRMLFAFAAEKDLDIVHWDVDSAFLQSNLTEEIYIKQPLGFIQPGEEHKVCRLNKAIYGLKQGSNAWNNRLDLKLRSIRLRRSRFDLCVYHHIRAEKYLILAVFVDDIIVYSNWPKVFNFVKGQLFSTFSMKDLGPVKKCFGIDVIRYREKGIIQLHQGEYIDSILKTFNMYECNSVSTPMEPGSMLKPADKNDPTFNDPSIPYQNAVGAIMFLFQCTRPDLAYSISSISKFNTKYDSSHWSMIKRILRYLKATRDYKLTYIRSRLPIYGYTDASFASDLYDPRSVCGYVFKLGKAAISWYSKRHPIIALSSTEAELYALTSGIQESIYLKNLATELRIQSRKTISIGCDNKSTINWIKNGNFSHRTKHIRVRRAFCKQRVIMKDIKISYVPTDQMLADILTKALAKPKFMNFLKYLGLTKANFSLSQK